MSKQFRTESGIEIQRFYSPQTTTVDYEKELGDPGKYPYTRGIHPGMYRDRLWMFRQITGHGTAKETLERAKYLRDMGGVSAEGIVPVTVYLDSAHHLGYDSDDPMAQYDFGRGGIALDTLEDLRELLSDFDLRKIHLNFQCFQESAPLLAMYLAAAQERGVPEAELRGGLENEVFGSFIYCKQEVFPAKSAVKLAWDATEHIARHMPRFTANVFSDASYLPAGANPIQAAAIALAAAMAYVEAGIARGMTIDEFADSLSFYVGTSRDFFEQVARIRALRRLWAQVTRDRYGARDPKSSMARIVVRTSTRDLTAQQPLCNIIRASVQALSAVLGGVQALTVTPYDEPICLPTEQSSLLSLRTQHILAEETGIVNTVDPLAGSYFVESLTNEIARRILDYVQTIEGLAEDPSGSSPAMDGMIKGIESGYFDAELLNSAWSLKQATQSGERVVVGVNKYILPPEETPVSRIAPETLDKKIEALKLYRVNRDSTKTKESLDKVRLAAQRGENTIHSMSNAFVQKATLGEVMSALRDVLGRFEKRN
ncbi:MAG: methylmalonyl-CoA mutase [Chloroflexi bacterium]|nr:methylmalonyl-CoA mutase [Chloroflexota bacterium]